MGSCCGQRRHSKHWRRGSSGVHPWTKAGEVGSARVMRAVTPGKRHYGWVIFSLSFTNLLVEGGVKNMVPVVYVALRDSFHWSAAATSGVFSLGGLTGALCAPLLGRLLDRIGARYLFPLGGLLILL